MRFGFGLVTALAVVAISGCGGGDGVSGLAPVSGTVTHNGEPLAGAEVLFIPDPTNQEGLPASDTTGPDGNYKVRTQNRFGLRPGKYKVVVSKSMLDMSKAPEDMQDDPYMYALSQGIDLGPDPTNSKAAILSGEFESEIPADGGVMDFDVKAASKP